MQMAQTIFDRYHPAVALLYCGVLLVFSMAVMQPVYLLLTFCGLLALDIALRGVKPALRNLVWQAPLIMILAIANPLFVSAGSTELFRVGMHAVYLESLLYGACQGLMFANVLLAFSLSARIISSDKVMCVLGNAAPTLALMLSMVMRLVPQFIRRGKTILSVQKACTSTVSPERLACTAAHPNAENVAAAPRREKHVAKRKVIASYLRLSTVLMGWGMEDSLETADAMRSRGWGASVKRTSYQRYRFRCQYALACAAIALVAAAAAASAWAACAQFSFYPRFDGIAPWFSYAPYAILVAFPVVAQAKENLA